MASLNTLVGSVFQSTNVSENGFVPDTSQLATNGTATIPADQYYYDDQDGSITDHQTITSVDLSTAVPGMRLGTMTLLDTTASGGSYPPFTYDIIGVNNGQILLGALYEGGNNWGSYLLLSNTDISESDGYTPVDLTFSQANPYAYSPPNQLASLVGTTFQPNNVSENGFAPDTTQLASSGVVTIPAGQYFGSDTDDGLADTQTIQAVDLTTANDYRLGTMTVLNTEIGGGSYPPITYDIIAVNSGEILLGFDYEGGDNWGSYVILANGDITEGDGYSPGTITFTTALGTYSTTGSVPCFASGTMVSTPDGARRVEHLAAGDLVTTLSGEHRAIVWAGHRRVDIARHRAPALVRPVRIAAGAFGPSLPNADLTVSPDHNIFVGGVLIPAKCLVNGLNVVELDVTAVTYHHIELETHDVVLANNLPAETYLDTGNRENFAGGAATVAHPDFASAPDMNYFAWVAQGCAPLVLAGPELDAARAVLATNARTASDAVAA
jgi:hypothetical protein